MGPLEWTLLLLLVALALLAGLLLRSRPQPRIVERGIFAGDAGPGLIRWEEIEGAYPPAVDDGNVLLLRLRLGERLARRLRRRNPELLPRPAAGEGFELRLDLSGAEVGPVEMIRQIVAHGREPGAEPAPGDARDSGGEAYQR
jgi:hypothetical protein